jgi:3-deoxy-manno-octulosonate cytidylyltransferase (CMP-KDO synthetase)
MSKIIIIIPVRLASTRLPNKPLADIKGQSMLSRVYQQAKKADIGEVLIACDGEEIAAEAKKINAKYIITDPNLASGTDRIFAAFKQYCQKYQDADFDVIVNLQGDLPTIDPEIIRIAALTAQNNDCDIVSVASKISEISEINNPNIVKIALTFNEKNDKEIGKALYFSRAPIPFNKDFKSDYFHHIGIYAYKKNALEKFIELPPSALEKTESLEQLRALENEMKILVKIVKTHPQSVDTFDDLKNVIDSLESDEK